MVHFYHTNMSSTLKRFAFGIHLYILSVIMPFEALFIQGMITWNFDPKFKEDISPHTDIKKL